MELILVCKQTRGKKYNVSWINFTVDVQLCVFFCCQVEYVKATEIARVKLEEKDKYQKEIQKIRHQVNFALLGGSILYLQEF